MIEPYPPFSWATFLTGSAVVLAFPVGGFAIAWLITKLWPRIHTLGAQRPRPPMKWWQDILCAMALLIVYAFAFKLLWKFFWFWGTR
jgi:hypothetical protein